MNIGGLLNIAGLVCLISCCAPKETSVAQPLTEQEMQEALIARNRALLKQERENIKAYTDSSEHEFFKTGSGLYYTVLNASGDTSDIVEGDRVEYEYDIKTIKESFIESSEASGNKFFRLLKDDGIIGMHEGIALMHPKDEYLFVVPAHLAYGYTTENGAPLNATLIYRVKIVSVIKTEK